MAECMLHACSENLDVDDDQLELAGADLSGDCIRWFVLGQPLVHVENMGLVHKWHRDGIDEPAGIDAGVVVRHVHATDLLYAVANQRERVGGAFLEVPVLALESNK